MNVVSHYNNEIRKIDISIKNLETRKLKLPLMAKYIDANIKTLKAKKEEIQKYLDDEVSMIDAYMENIFKDFNNIGYKLN